MNSSLVNVTALALAAVCLSLGAEERYDRDGATVYLERITPPGPVEPARPAPGGAGLPAEQGYLGDPTWRNQPSQREAGPQRLDDAAVLAAFSSRYKSAGSPRLAVYFNRELSDEVREWVPTGQVVEQTDYNSRARVDASHKGVTYSQKGEDESVDYHKGSVGATARVQGSETRSVTGREYIEPTGYRRDPREVWKWEFEDGVAATFLSARTKIVDRNLIFRLMAKNSPQTAGMAGTVSTTVNEMGALQKYADVLVEVLVVRSSNSYTGYDFRATAKDIKSGTLIATAFLRGDENPNPVESGYVAGSSGYSKVERQKLPTVAEVSRYLTIKLMDSMAANLSAG